ncbi:MAG: FIST signal transduction protein [Deltaproteobacteria bacterium]
MIEIGVGISIEKNAVLAAEEAVRRALRNKVGLNRPNLAILFCTSDIPYPPVLKALTSQLENIPIIGMSGSAVFAREGVFTHGLALMLFTFPADVHFSTACVKDLKTKPVQQAGEEFGEDLLQSFKNIPRHLGLTLFDRVVDQGLNFIGGMQQHLGRSFPCLGACAADPINPTRARLFYNGSAYADACCGLLLGGKMSFGFGIQHGWKPLGKPRTITGAIGSSIHTIENQPAVKLYEEYLASTLSELKKEITKLSVFYPIGIKIEGEDEYLIRNVVFIDDDGSLHCQGNIPEGASIRLMISTKETCLNATSAAVDAAQRQLASPVMKFYKERASKFAIAFSSFSRYTLLRRDAPQELEMVKRGLGETPFIGIYTASELAPMSAATFHGQMYFHNQSFSLMMVEG